MIQSSGDGDAEHEILSPSSDSWTEAQIPGLCTSWTSVALPNLSTTTDIQSLAEQVQHCCSPTHPRTESEDNGLDVGALLEKAADRFSISMDAKIETMMEQLDKRIEDKIDSKLIPVMDRISALEERTSTSSTRSGPPSSSDGSSGSTTGPVIFAPSYLEMKGWCAFKDRNTRGLTEGQAREFITKLRQGIGSDLDSLIARVGAMRVRNTKIMLLEESKSFKLQTDQRGNVCLYRKGEHQAGRGNSLRD